MATMTEEELNTASLEKLRRKRDQAWELAGCARRDRDTMDELRWMEEALRIQRRIEEVR